MVRPGPALDPRAGLFAPAPGTAPARVYLHGGPCHLAGLPHAARRLPRRVHGQPARGHLGNPGAEPNDQDPPHIPAAGQGAQEDRVREPRDRQPRRAPRHARQLHHRALRLPRPRAAALGAIGWPRVALAPRPHPGALRLPRLRAHQCVDAGALRGPAGRALLLPRAQRAVRGRGGHFLQVARGRVAAGGCRVRGRAPARLPARAPQARALRAPEQRGLLHV
mmetsp:Transcript_22016/g.64920  ORF Transcript_22016/g.64920 Transcript_22016/m.64920 type:complete len:222 (+) Transcript_22016:1540-2205(+)